MSPHQVPLLLALLFSMCLSFTPPGIKHSKQLPPSSIRGNECITQLGCSVLCRSKNKDDDDDENKWELEDEDIQVLWDDEHSNSDETSKKRPKTPQNLDPMEKAWRHAKKPLLSIGSKGATLTHGNSLRQLLEAHTAVKVKVNTRRFNNSLETAFEELERLAIEAGSPPEGLELLQARDSEKIILLGLPGTRQAIQNGEFPPPPPPPRPSKDE